MSPLFSYKSYSEYVREKTRNKIAVNNKTESINRNRVLGYLKNNNMVVEWLCGLTSKNVISFVLTLLLQAMRTETVQIAPHVGSNFTFQTNK
jgi:Arc/MetJ-type ribon-helix-helix transcriptional regulator